MLNNTSNNQLVYLCEPLSSFHSKCVLYIHGTANSAFKAYMLDDRSDTYTFPVAGIIESIQLTPDNVSVIFNDKEIEFTHTLIGRNISRDDVLRFTKVKGAANLYVQIVLQCPLNRNG